MILFKTKPMAVAVGADLMNQAVVTTENGKTIGMPFEFFKALFEPENDDAREWMRAMDNRFNPKPMEYELEQHTDDDGRVKFRGKMSGG